MRQKVICCQLVSAACCVHGGYWFLVMLMTVPWEQPSIARGRGLQNAALLVPIPLRCRSCWLLPHCQQRRQWHAFAHPAARANRPGSTGL